MAGICFFFEDYDADVWSGRAIDLDAWNYASKAAGDIDHMIVVNRTDQIIRTPDADLKFEVVTEVPELPNAVTVCCPWKGGEPLWTFDHEVDWYIFGPSEGWTENFPSDQQVHLPIAGRGALHSVHVASVVLTHRYKVLSWQ